LPGRPEGRNEWQRAFQAPTGAFFIAVFFIAEKRGVLEKGRQNRHERQRAA